MTDETFYDGRMALKRTDNVGTVVEDLGGAIDFFRELGLELEGRATIEGELAGRVTGLGRSARRECDAHAGRSRPVTPFQRRCSTSLLGIEKLENIP